MWQYIFFTLKHQKAWSTLAASGFLLASCALLLLSATTQTTVLQANQTISRNWRSTYDLVVLPAQTSLPSDSVIPPDEFEGYDGGISLEQYQQIKELSGVEVAAPIAFISYVQFPTTVALFGSSHLLPGFYELDWKLTAFNGQKRLTEYHTQVKIYASPAPCAEPPCDLPGNVKKTLSTIGVSDYFFPAAGPYFTGVPDQGAFLLAAIDPEAENQLVHLNKSIIKGKALPQQNTLSMNRDQPHLAGIVAGEVVPNYDVPLLINTQLSGQIALHASFVRFLTNIIDPQQIELRGASAYLDRLPRQTVFDGNVPIAQNNLQIFSQGATLVQDNSTLEIQNLGNPSFPLNFSSRPSRLTYRSATNSPISTGVSYTLIPSNTQPPDGTQGTEVAFRNLNPLPGDMEAVGITLGYTYQTINYTIYNGNVYTAQPVGQFDGKQLSAQFTDALNWLPENTYTSSPAVLRYDAQGHPVRPTNVLPTTNPAGFTLQSPLALTTLAAARQIRGDHCISVIRVRVAGNITPDEAGWKRVAQVAQEIHQRTGLQALVTLGSSPSPTLVYVPGIKQGYYGATQSIAPLGWVEERWIALGVGIIYLKQLGQTQLLFLGAILLVCLGYLTVTLSALVAAQRREMAVLSALGWEPWQSAASFLAQALLLALFGATGGIGIALLMIFLIGVSPPWTVVDWTIPAILGLALLSALYPLWQLWRIEPAEVLRQGTAISAHRQRVWLGTWIGSHLPALLALALRNLARSRLRSLIALGCLFLSAALLTVMIDGLFAFRQTLQGTLLGDYVLLQTAVPQLAGAVVTVLLTFLSVADLLLLQVRERRKEIGLLQAVGWRPRLVERLFVQEGMALALLGTLPGVLVALVILLAEHQLQNGVPVPLIGIATVLFMLLVSALATLPAIQASRRIPLMDILRAE